MKNTQPFERQSPPFYSFNPLTTLTIPRFITSTLKFKSSPNFFSPQSTIAVNKQILPQRSCREFFFCRRLSGKRKVPLLCALRVSSEAGGE
jgi:hypothetical protein